MFPARLANLDAARSRFGDRVDRLLPFLNETDPLGDAVVEELARSPQGWPEVNRGLEKGARVVPESMPALRGLLTFCERVPAWVEWDELDRGGSMLLRAGPLGGTVLGAESLVYGYCSPGGNKPLVMSGRLRDQAARRLNETARFVHATVVPGGLRPPTESAPSGEGYRITVKVRVMHAQVRKLLRASGKWRSELWGEPINQHDMVATSLLFSAIVLDGLRKLGFSVTAEESDAYMQLWRYSGHLIGVDPELMPSSEREARRLGELITATEAPPDDDSRALVSALMSAGATEARNDEERDRARRYAKFAEGVCRGLIGDDLADQLALPRNGWRFSVPAVRTVVRGMEVVRRRVPLGDRFAQHLGERYWAQVVKKGLADPPDFRAPERLAVSRHLARLEPRELHRIVRREHRHFVSVRAHQLA